MDTVAQAIQYCIRRSIDPNSKTRRHGIPGNTMKSNISKLNRFDPKEGEGEGEETKTGEAANAGEGEGAESAGEGGEGGE